MTALGKLTYLVWLLGCAGPILLLQWVVFGRRLRARARAIFGAAGIVGAFLTFADGTAIADNVWGFSPELTLGVGLGPIPLEEILFFFLTALLVTQSMALFAPYEPPTRLEPGRRDQL